MNIDEIIRCVKEMDIDNLHLVSHGDDAFGIRLSPETAEFFKEYLEASLIEKRPF